MRFLVFFSLLLCAHQSLSAPTNGKDVPIDKEVLDISDVDQIEKLTADYSISLDKLDFSALSAIFTPNATYDLNNPKIPFLRGIETIKTTLAKLAPPGTISQHAVGTWSIDFSSDKTASGVTYSTATYFGKDKLDGEVLTIYGYIRDTFIKTSQPGHGGWRINTRVLEYFVRVFFFLVLLLEKESSIRKV